jgi:hypothetical protein
MNKPDVGRIPRAGRILAAVALSVTSFLVLPTPAEAGFAQCTHWHEVKPISFAPDKHRVGVNCSNISAGTYVQGYLDMSGCCDKETVWFNRTNYAYYTEWAQGFYSTSGVRTKQG